ncbi:MAG: tetratricopeptide repeat protein, partial [FCB group bacterium]|nr:tetratricopeptide repeat protein [FCB group bacterium]
AILKPKITNRKYYIILAVIGTIFIFNRDLINIFQKNNNEEILQEIKSFREDFQRVYGKDIYLGDLLETKDPLLLEKLQLGTAEAAKQQKDATLKAIEYYKQGLSLDIKTSERCALLNLTALAYDKISELDSAFALWEELQKTADKIAYSQNSKTAREGQEFLSYAFGNMGIVYSIKGDWNMALDMNDKALQINLALGNKEGEANIYCNMGIVHKSKGDLDKAMEMYNKALQIVIEMGNKEVEAALYNNMGVVYKYKDDLDKAMEFYDKALQINLALGRKEGEAEVYGNMGTVYRIKDDLDEALKMYEKALEIDIALGNKKGIACEFGNMGNVYMTKGDWDEALEIYDKALEINLAVGRKEGTAINYSNIALVHISKGDFPKAKEYFIKSLKLYEDLGAKIEIEKVKRELAELEPQIGTDKDR